MGAKPLRFLLIPPPIHTEDLDSPLPESILLDPFGYLSDRINATTADGRRSRKNCKRIRVTFWIASPPRVSCFTVHCPDLKPEAFGEIPKVLCTEGDLALIRIAFSSQRPDLYGNIIRYFVYQAGTEYRSPSLSLLRTPPDFKISDNEVVLLRHKDMFYLAVLRWSFIDWQNPHKFFNLHLYNSKTGRWSTKLMHLDVPQNFSFNSPTKGITIGGEFGSVGWVDLWNGILTCDLLRNSESVHYIPVPSPLVANSVKGYPLSVRNIIVFEGCIKFFELHNHVKKSADTEGSWITESWVAATKRIKISSIGSSNNWEEDFTIKCSDEILVDSQMLGLKEGGDTKLSFKGIHPSYPVMSLHDGDVVYIMHTPDGFEGKAYVIALDMRNKTVKGVADFRSGRPLGYGFTYLESEISKYLGIWSSTRHIRNAAETK